MKSYRQELFFNIPKRRAFINITPQVQECVRASGIKEGLVLVNSMHITSSVFINDDESGLHHDYEVWLEKLAPHEPIRQYQHNNTGEDNADAHLKRQVMCAKGQRDAKWSSLSRTANWILARGNRFFMESLTGIEESECW